ncbi:hypothetical protein HMPREF0021_00007 [Acinetobacter baumannii 6013150]|nr:hypothetical protein HMPREF0021_00007 [Acinetobacter baumannii 6013150]EGJ62670.1 hypothetical protein HMPREF0020_03673 [Acinetobacter baumannii 6013113]
MIKTAGHHQKTFGKHQMKSTLTQASFQLCGSNASISFILCVGSLFSTSLR